MIIFHKKTNVEILFEFVNNCLENTINSKIYISSKEQTKNMLDQLQGFPGSRKKEKKNYFYNRQ